MSSVSETSAMDDHEEGANHGQEEVGKTPIRMRRVEAPGLVLTARPWMFGNAKVGARDTGMPMPNTTVVREKEEPLDNPGFTEIPKLVHEDVNLGPAA